jgi:hypothetical protein
MATIVVTGWTWLDASGSRCLVTVNIAVGRSHQIRATEPGDWAFHCHKSHHTMNAMGHDVPTVIGVDHRDVARRVTKLIPDYMVMGERGMADMAEMEMPLPDNTIPMMTGQGPYGSVEMGGMFTVVNPAVSSAATTRTRLVSAAAWQLRAVDRRTARSRARRALVPTPLTMRARKPSGRPPLTEATMKHWLWIALSATARACSWRPVSAAKVDYRRPRSSRSAARPTRNARRARSASR